MDYHYDYDRTEQKQEAALREARTRRLAKLAKANRPPRSQRANACSPWGNALSLLRGAWLSGSTVLQGKDAR
jgi:hypothetical protein